MRRAAILLERKPRETLVKTAFPRDLLTNLAISSGCEGILVATFAHSGSLVPRVIGLKLPFRFRPNRDIPQARSNDGLWRDLDPLGRT